MRVKLSSSKRENLVTAWKNRCVYCGESVNARFVQVDHAIPLVLQNQILLLSKFVDLPTLNLNDDWNLFPTCKSCNNWKGGNTVLGFRNELEQQVSRCEKYSRNYRMAIRFGLLKIEKEKVVFLMDECADRRILDFDVQIAQVAAVKEANE